MTIYHGVMILITLEQPKQFPYNKMSMSMIIIKGVHPVIQSAFLKCREFFLIWPSNLYLRDGSWWSHVEPPPSVCLGHCFWCFLVRWLKRFVLLLFNVQMSSLQSSQTAVFLCFVSFGKWQNSFILSLLRLFGCQLLCVFFNLAQWPNKTKEGRKPKCYLLFAVSYIIYWCVYDSLVNSVIYYFAEKTTLDLHMGHVTLTDRICTVAK